jgi:hypothetical protein
MEPFFALRKISGYFAALSPNDEPNLGQLNSHVRLVTSFSESARPTVAARSLSATRFDSA